MKTDRINHILYQTTRLKIEKPESKPKDQVEAVIQMFRPPSGKGLVPVDCELMVVEVDPAKATKFSQELVELLKDYPNPKVLRAGPSYVQMSRVLEKPGGRPDIEAALRLFALGKVLGFWQLRTPKDFGAVGPQAKRMAKQGHIVITGFDPFAASPPKVPSP